MNLPVDAAAEEPPAPPPPGGRGVARNTAIFSLGTGISRIVGLGREILFASYFGTTGPASAYTIASLVPNLVANLFAQSALSAAFKMIFRTSRPSSGPCGGFAPFKMQSAKCPIWR